MGTENKCIECEAYRGHSPGCSLMSEEYAKSELIKLVNKYLSTGMLIRQSKECVLIAVDEIDLHIQKSTPKNDIWANLQPLEYWQEVKREVVKL
jgi:hypothetical protein